MKFPNTQFETRNFFLFIEHNSVHKGSLWFNPAYSSTTFVDIYNNPIKNRVVEDRYESQNESFFLNQFEK